jgi:O-antigen/teichoic acid export membrane protein
MVAALFIVAARNSGPTEYGLVTTAIAVGGSMMGFFDFGSNSLWIRASAAGSLSDDELNSRATLKVTIAVGIAAIGVILAVFVDPRLLVACGVFLAGTVAQVVLVPIRAARRGEIVALMILVERLASLAIFFSLLLSGAAPLQALWISLVGGTSVMAGAAYITTPRGRMRPTFGRLRNPWRGSKYYGIGGLASSGQQLDLPLLGLVSGAPAAGIFSGVNRWTQPMGLLSSAVSSASAPFIAGASDWDATRRLVVRASWLLAVAVSVCVCLAITAPVLVPWILGEDFSGSAIVLQWLAIGTVPAILNQPLASALQSRRYERLVAFIYLAAVAVQLILVATLGSLIGALGAAIAYCLLQTIMLTALAICIFVLYRRERSPLEGEV